jgi:hypothetical protein
MRARPSKAWPELLHDAGDSAREKDLTKRAQRKRHRDHREEEMRRRI